MMLVSPLPTIHFKPVENKKKAGKGRIKILVDSCCSDLIYIDIPYPNVTHAIAKRSGIDELDLANVKSNVMLFHYRWLTVFDPLTAMSHRVIRAKESSVVKLPLATLKIKSIHSVSQSPSILVLGIKPNVC